MNGKSLPMRDLLTRSPVIPILTIHDAAIAGDLARALFEGGLFAFEVVMRTPEALKAIEAMRLAAPEAAIGAGTLLKPDDVDRAVDAGAQFGVSPGLSPDLAARVHHHHLPFLPGAVSASEIMQAVDLGFSELKFFPAFGPDGIAWLKMMAPVFPKVLFCPTGGIRKEDVAGYVTLPNCRTIGCSWVAPSKLVASGDWAAITALAREAAAMRRTDHA